MRKRGGEWEGGRARGCWLWKRKREINYLKIAPRSKKLLCPTFLFLFVRACVSGCVWVCGCMGVCECLVSVTKLGSSCLLLLSTGGGAAAVLSPLVRPWRHSEHWSVGVWLIKVWVHATVSFRFKTIIGISFKLNKIRFCFGSQKVRLQSRQYLQPFASRAFLRWLFCQPRLKRCHKKRYVMKNIPTTHSS